MKHGVTFLYVVRKSYRSLTDKQTNNTYNRKITEKTDFHPFYNSALLDVGCLNTDEKGLKTGKFGLNRTKLTRVCILNIDNF